MRFYCSRFGSSRAPDVSICITANGLRSLALWFRPFILEKGCRILNFLSDSEERCFLSLMNDAFSHLSFKIGHNLLLDVDVYVNNLLM